MSERILQNLQFNDSTKLTNQIKMKTFAKQILLVALLFVAVAVQAQKPYKHSIGLSVGSFEGASYKVFLTNDVALQTDLGFRLLSTQGGNDSYSTAMDFWTFEVNPNALYQGSITGWNWGGVAWFAGGGISLGLARDFGSSGPTYGKWGFNAIGGAELGLDDAPLAFSLDFRPGYGMQFRSDYKPISFFDWALVAGIRYTF